jgi:AraC-like DNA-binding protein
MAVIGKKEPCSGVDADVSGGLSLGTEQKKTTISSQAVLQRLTSSHVKQPNDPTAVRQTVNKALLDNCSASMLLSNPDRGSQVRAIADLPRVIEVPDVSARGMTLKDRLALARERLRQAAENGVRIRVYEVALDLDMSEFHFARQFRAAYGCSPHVFYDEVRATQARRLLTEGCTPGQAARRIGLRRPAELRALLAKRLGDAASA